MKAVAKVIKCDKKTVKYWLDRWDQCKDLTDLQRSGRPRATTTEDDQQINQIAEQETFATSHDIKEDLAMRGVEVTQRTIRCRLNEAGAKFSLRYEKTTT